MSLKLTILFAMLCNLFMAQQKEYWLIDMETKQKKNVKDSISAVKFLDSLVQHNYYFTELKDVRKNIYTTEIFYKKGENINEAFVIISDTIALELKLNSEFYSKNLDSLKKQIHKYYINYGYAFSRIKTKYLGKFDNKHKVKLHLDKNVSRKIDNFKIKGYDKVPSRFVKNLEKEHSGKLYNEKTLSSIHNGLINHPFVTLDRSPQTLFTKDSTSIYLFLQRKKVNSLDGLIGFGNDKTDKISFTGSANLNFKNIFNGFESISIFWQRNPDKGQTFDLQTDIPYLFKSNIGTNFNLNIYRQDSTFANVKVLPALYYNLSNRQKIGIRGNFEVSTILDTLYINGKDYTKNGIGLWYEYNEPSEIDLFISNTKIKAEADILNTNYTKNNFSAKQYKYYIELERNFRLYGNNFINIRAESSMLQSVNELSINELIRFGGWNSMRGFNEESLIADFYAYSKLEYRYLVNNQAFFDLFGQFGHMRNKSLGVKPNLISFGLGFNFVLPIGIMNFHISNGNELGNEIKFSDTKVHWGILTRF